MMGDEDEAKDLLQDSFVDAFTKISNLRKVETFGAWLKRIVINNCLNALKKKKLVYTGLEENPEPVEETVEDLDYVNYEAERIMEAIDHLPHGSRTVLQLYLFEGYDHKEIGQILSITESASKAQYSKAKSRIRKILTEENDG